MKVHLNRLTYILDDVSNSIYLHELDYKLSDAPDFLKVGKGALRHFDFQCRPLSIEEQEQYFVERLLQATSCPTGPRNPPTQGSKQELLSRVKTLLIVFELHSHTYYSS